MSVLGAQGEGEGQNYTDTPDRPRARVEKTPAGFAENQGGAVDAPPSNETPDTPPTDAEVIACLTPESLQWLDDLKISHAAVSDSTELIAEQSLHVRSNDYRNANHVWNVLGFLGDAEQRLRDYENLLYRLRLPLYGQCRDWKFSRNAHKLIDADTWSVSSLLSDTERLITDCKSFLAVAARYWHIIGPGAPLTDDARLELAYAIRPLVADVAAAADDKTPPLEGENTPAGTKQSEGEKPKANVKGKNIKARMLMMLSKDEEAYLWSKEKWAIALSCSTGSIPKETWGTIMTYRAHFAAESVINQNREESAPKGRRKPAHKHNR